MKSSCDPPRWVATLIWSEGKKILSLRSWHITAAKCGNWYIIWFILNNNIVSVYFLFFHFHHRMCNKCVYTWLIQSYSEQLAWPAWQESSCPCVGVWVSKSGDWGGLFTLCPHKTHFSPPLIALIGSSYSIWTQLCWMTHSHKESKHKCSSFTSETTASKPDWDATFLNNQGHLRELDNGPKIITRQLLFVRFQFPLPGFQILRWYILSNT